MADKDDPTKRNLGDYTEGGTVELDPEMIKKSLEGDAALGASHRDAEKEITQDDPLTGIHRRQNRGVAGFINNLINSIASVFVSLKKKKPSHTDDDESSVSKTPVTPKPEDPFKEEKSQIGEGTISRMADTEKDAKAYRWKIHPFMKPVQKAQFFSSRIILVLLSLAFNGFLVFNAISLWGQPEITTWALLVTGFAAISVLLTLGAFLFMWPLSVFVAPSILFSVLLISVQVVLYGSFDNSVVLLGGHSISDYFNLLFAVYLVLQIVLIALFYPRFWIVYGVVGSLIAYGLLGAWMNMSHRVLFESSWMGVGFLKGAFFFVQPAFLTLHATLPMLLVMGLFSIALIVRQGEAKIGWLVLNLLVTLMLTVTGAKLLMDHHVPSVAYLFAKKTAGVGVASIEYEGRTITIATSDYDSLKNLDTIDRVKVALVPFPEDTVPSDGAKEVSPDLTSLPQTPVEKSNKKKFYLSVSNFHDQPVFFLTKNHFQLRLDGERINKWTFRPLISPKEKPKRWDKKYPAPLYIVTVSSLEKGPQISWSDAARADYSTEENIEFALSTESTVASYEVLMDENNVETVDPVPADQRNFAIPLAKLASGPHQIKVIAYGPEQQASILKKEIMIKSPLSVVIDSPSDGDSVAGQLNVLAHVDGDLPYIINKVSYSVDDQELMTQVAPPLQAEIDIAALADGPHSLKVTSTFTQAEGGEEKNIESKISFFKGAHPEVEIVTPSYGENLSLKTNVSLKAPENAAVSFWVDGKQIRDWRNSPPNFVWDTRDLSDGFHVIVAKIKTAEGSTGSVWSQVNKESGSVSVMAPAESPVAAGDILPPEAAGPHADVLPDVIKPAAAADVSKSPFSPVVFVLDGTISMNDGWGIADKWEWQRKVFNGASVSQKLGGTQVGVVLNGINTPYYKGDCSDVFVLEKPGDFNADDLAGKIRSYKPQGLSSLYSSVEKAISFNPQKVIVLTDGADSCRTKMTKSLVSKIAASSVVVDVVALGDINSAAMETLSKLASAGRGTLIVSEKPEDLDQKISSLLNFYYQVSQNGEVLLTAPLDGQVKSLPAGTYDLRLSVMPPFETRPIVIRSGITNKIDLWIDGNATKVLESENFNLINQVEEGLPAQGPAPAEGILPPVTENTAPATLPQDPYQAPVPAAESQPQTVAPTPSAEPVLPSHIY